jgi:hypothetical protein
MPVEVASAPTNCEKGPTYFSKNQKSFYVALNPPRINA